jgi:hypothetical protein
MSKLKRLEELFARRHFDREVIIWCVRRYLRYKLSFRDLVGMMAERAESCVKRRIPLRPPSSSHNWLLKAAEPRCGAVV